MENVLIKDEYITLGQLLKLVNIISNGGAAKSFLLAETILVNGDDESRRGRKLYANDVISYKNKTFKIVK